MITTLLVEDNLFFRQSIRWILKERFPLLDISEAGDGLEALEYCHQTSPDLVFLDINLPKLNGLELCKSIREEYPATVIIILTNYDIPEYRQVAMKNGADHFLLKDLRQEEILSLVALELGKMSLRAGTDRP
jgi:YesN/AraC family two-component response regulator